MHIQLDWRKAFGLLTFLLSGALSILVGASVAAFHMPFRAESDGLRNLTLRYAAERSWTAVDVLSASCLCSRNVASHLIARGPLFKAQERVLLAGPDRSLRRSLQNAGFPVTQVDAEELTAKYGLPGAPWFLVLDPRGELVYAGGYSADRDGRSGYRDLSIWHEALRGSRAAPLPVFGCALGARLQNAMDPLGLKRSGWLTGSN